MMRRWDLRELPPREDPALNLRKNIANHLVASHLSSDNRLLAVAAADQCRVWDLSGTAPKEVELPGNAFDMVQPMGFSPDSQVLVTRDRHGLLRFHNLQAITLKKNGFAGAFNQGTGDSALFSRDGKRMYEYSREERAIHCWTLKEDAPAEKFSIPIPGEVVWGNLRMSADGGTLALRQMSQVHVWDLGGAQPRLRATLNHHLFVKDLSLSSNGRRCVCTTQDWNEAVVIWDLGDAEPKRLHVIGLQDEGWAVAFLPGDNHIIYSSTITGQLTLLDLTGRQPDRKWIFPGAISGLIAAPDGRHIITQNTNGTIYVLRLSPPETAR
jgi:WD40 repeat protein